MAGTLVISTISDGTNSTSSTNAIQGSAKAWVNFNGVTTTTINASHNVSSVTRNAAGDYTVNFTIALVDANYVAVGMSRAQTTGAVSGVVVEEHFDTAPTTSAFRLNTKQTGTRIDTTDCHVAFFR